MKSCFILLYAVTADSVGICQKSGALFLYWSWNNPNAHACRVLEDLNKYSETVPRYSENTESEDSAFTTTFPEENCNHSIWNNNTAVGRVTSPRSTGACSEEHRSTGRPSLIVFSTPPGQLCPRLHWVHTGRLALRVPQLFQEKYVWEVIFFLFLSAQTYAWCRLRSSELPCTLGKLRHKGCSLTFVRASAGDQVECNI